MRGNHTADSPGAANGVVVIGGRWRGAMGPFSLPVAERTGVSEPSPATEVAAMSDRQPVSGATPDQ